MSVDTQPTSTVEPPAPLNDRWGRFTGWLKSLAPEGRQIKAHDQLVKSINAAGAATQLWMIELTRQQLQITDTLGEEDRVVLDEMSARFSQTMVESGADPSVVIRIVNGGDQP